ncbi:hypothetical protein ACFW05_12650, partial [Streptomyces albogriseolus]
SLADMREANRRWQAMVRSPPPPPAPAPDPTGGGPPETRSPPPGRAPPTRRATTPRPLDRKRLELVLARTGEGVWKAKALSAVPVQGEREESGR